MRALIDAGRKDHRRWVDLARRFSSGALSESVSAVSTLSNDNYLAGRMAAAHAITSQSGGADQDLHELMAFTLTNQSLDYVGTNKFNQWHHESKENQEYLKEHEKKYGHYYGRIMDLDLGASGRIEAKLHKGETYEGSLIIGGKTTGAVPELTALTAQLEKHMDLKKKKLAYHHGIMSPGLRDMDVCNRYLRELGKSSYQFDSSPVERETEHFVDNDFKRYLQSNQNPHAVTYSAGGRTLENAVLLQSEDSSMRNKINQMIILQVAMAISERSLLLPEGVLQVAVVHTCDLATKPTENFMRLLCNKRFLDKKSTLLRIPRKEGSGFVYLVLLGGTENIPVLIGKNQTPNSFIHSLDGTIQGMNESLSPELSQALLNSANIKKDELEKVIKGHFEKAEIYDYFSREGFSEKSQKESIDSFYELIRQRGWYLREVEKQFKESQLSKALKEEEKNIDRGRLPEGKSPISAVGEHTHKIIREQQEASLEGQLQYAVQV